MQHLVASVAIFEENLVGQNRVNHEDTNIVTDKKNDKDDDSAPETALDAVEIQRIVIINSF